MPSPLWVTVEGEAPSFIGEWVAALQDNHDPTQADQFKELARELECDEDEEAFKAKLRTTAQAPKSGTPAKKPPDKG